MTTAPDPPAGGSASEGRGMKRPVDQLRGNGNAAAHGCFFISILITLKFMRCLHGFQALFLSWGRRDSNSGKGVNDKMETLGMGLVCGVEEGSRRGCHCCS